MKKRILEYFLFFLAFLTMLYFIVLMSTIGPGFRFNYMWLFGSFSFLGIALILRFSKRGFEWIPKPFLFMIEVGILAGCFLFIVVEGMMVVQSRKKPECEADYLVVLGAKVNGTSPSKILKYRIEKAAWYLEHHPNTKAVVSGGKGMDEGISEAEAMKNELVKFGIEEERIYMEDASTSTKENLEFSKDYMDITNHNIIIVTTDFHLLRAVKIAEKTGYKKVEGLAAKSVWYLIPTNYVREFLALVKEKVVGNI
ncbi:MAG: YdcF family protein [Lachnospiraceae bacterium]|nr:YdcF family protein [Lachnospiraceae bacterium]